VAAADRAQLQEDAVRPSAQSVWDASGVARPAAAEPCSPVAALPVGAGAGKSAAPVPDAPAEAVGQYLPPVPTVAPRRLARCTPAVVRFAEQSVAVADLPELVPASLPRRAFRPREHALPEVQRVVVVQPHSDSQPLV